LVVDAAVVAVAAAAAEHGAAALAADIVDSKSCLFRWIESCLSERWIKFRNDRYC
jgi:hypothetical protein